MAQQPEFLAFDDKESLADKLALTVAGDLREAAQLRGQATLVVSGGGTPVPFFKALKQATLPWDKITILCADERWVSPDSDDSNEKLVREHLLHQEATLLSLAPEEGESLEAGVARLTSELQALALPLDVTILGMGEDGHTASLFPGHPALSQGLHGDALCLAVTDSPKPPPKRITLTAKLLCASHHLMLHITGEGKKAVYEKAMQSDDETAYPIAGILKRSENTPTVYWTA